MDKTIFIIIIIVALILGISIGLSTPDSNCNSINTDDPPEPPIM